MEPEQTHVVSRAQIRNLLEQWARGLVAHAQVQQWAEARFTVDHFAPEDAAANEVLACLDALDIHVVTKADIPYLLSALDSATAEEAARLIASRPFDLAARRREYGADPVYGPFLGGTGSAA